MCEFEENADTVAGTNLPFLAPWRMLDPKGLAKPSKGQTKTPLAKPIKRIGIRSIRPIG
jgi:hypothetical protein